MTENEVAKQIVDVAFKVHTTFGPGLLESVYETIMAHELKSAGFEWFANKPSQLSTRALEWTLGFVLI